MNPAQRILIALVRCYQWTLSPLKTAVLGPGARCRFTPSCSEYALQAVRSFGAWSGGRLALRRLLRCHPWGDCGHDPVPPADPTKKSARVNPKTGLTDPRTMAAACRK
jgi:putative membrane protein insertion efficiency factor